MLRMHRLRLAVVDDAEDLDAWHAVVSVLWARS
jgi:hypothetical protein